jgi:hypothetical protein
MSKFFSDIGEAIKGDDYDAISEEYYNSKLSLYNSQKVSLGVSKAKQNIIEGISAKSESCVELLHDPKIDSYSSSVLGVEKMKNFAD